VRSSGFYLICLDQEKQEVYIMHIHLLEWVLNRQLHLHLLIWTDR
jgi:hypothetical protein